MSFQQQHYKKKPRHTFFIQTFDMQHLRTQLQSRHPFGIKLTHAFSATGSSIFGLSSRPKYPLSTKFYGTGGSRGGQDENGVGRGVGVGVGGGISSRRMSTQVHVGGGAASRCISTEVCQHNQVSEFWNNIRLNRTVSNKNNPSSSVTSSSHVLPALNIRKQNTPSRKRPRTARRHLSTMHMPLPYDPEAITKQLINERHVDDVYELGEEIGAGAFGWVIKATHRETGVVRAMKAQSVRDNKWCFRELEMASRVEHPNCANAIDAFLHKDKLLIVSPLYTGSDLYDYIVDDNRTAFTEHHAFDLCLQMLSALEACHRSGFAHLDVKPENFMFKYAEPGSPLVLVDYGSAEPFEKAAYAETSDEYVAERDDVLTTLSRITGTACYMSPEVARGNFSSRSDVWSAAICLYILMALEPPFEMTLKPRSSADQDCRLPTEEPRFQQTPNLTHPAISTMTENGRQLMVNMMHHNPALRLSATEALAGISAHLAALEARGMAEDNLYV